jgi:WD40 repeat protein
MQIQKAVEIPSNSMTFTQNNILVPGDVVSIILNQLANQLRVERPKAWGSLKQVCSSFNRIINKIENANKICFYNNVFYQEISSFDDEPPNQTNYWQFAIATADQLVAFKQLGRDTHHFWAPFLTCNEQHQLNLYEIHPGEEQAAHVATYNQHKAKLTAAISLGARHIVSADESGAVAVWSTLPLSPEGKTASPVRFYEVHKKAVTCVDFVNDCEFVSGGKDTKVITWNINSAEPKHTLNVDGEVGDLRAISQDELLVCTLHNLQDAKLTWYSNNVPIKSFKCRFDSNIYNFFNADEIRIASGNRVVGISNFPFSHTLGSINLIDPPNPETTKMKFSHPETGEHGFFSRSNHYCHAKRLQEKYYVTLCQESAELEKALPNNSA